MRQLSAIVSLCPTRALKIVKSDCTLRENANWQNDTIKEIYKQSNSGGVLLSSMGNPKPLPVYWDKTLMQGHASGVNMSGGDEVFDEAIPMNSIGFFGLHAMTAGSYEGEIYDERAEVKLKRLFTRDSRLVGFILIGETERAGIYTSLIRERTPLDTINFEL